MVIFSPNHPMVQQNKRSASCQNRTPEEGNEQFERFLDRNDYFFPTYWNILFFIQSKSWALLWANYNSDIKDEHSTCMYKITLIIYKGCSSMTKSKVIFFFFCKGTDSTYFRHYGPYYFCCSY